MVAGTGGIVTGRGLIVSNTRVHCAPAQAAGGNSRGQRPFRELVKDANSNPSRWRLVRREEVPSTNLRNKGGTSVQELLRCDGTGEEIVRHTLLKPDGSFLEPPHFRPIWK
jgi:hypothetical protein